MQEANGNFNEVAEFAKKNEVGTPVGIWGLMSDFTRSFKPWEENFSKGLYLAGVEVEDNAVTPEGWVKWTSPAYEYVYVKVESNMMKAFEIGLNYIKEQKLQLVGAVYDYICPEEEGQLYLFFLLKNYKQQGA
ncbi:AraC family transcriptional regulator [Cellulosilyticum ruminicola]|uniref:AraC family transcriptional regulator n=1 Tax=Cellulosilyticum ruminicola TaxID=425254 RepID=UPI000A9F3B48|nr:AraC family transcriptional regulator [Cellulosilyticum ruminicola]